MRKLLAVLLAVGVIGGVAGCSAATESDPATVSTQWYKTGDGRTVMCLRDGHGMSCDWENAK